MEKSGSLTVLKALVLGSAQFVPASADTNATMGHGCISVHSDVPYFWLPTNSIVPAIFVISKASVVT